MARIEGTLARMFDFGDEDLPLSGASHRAGLRLAARGTGLAGPDKYRVLEHRRRQAQIRARRVLDLVDLMDTASARRY